MGGEDAVGEGLHGLGGPDGGIEAAVVEEADGVFHEESLAAVAGDVQGDVGMGEDGEGVDVVFGESGVEEGEEHFALAEDLKEGGFDADGGAPGAGLEPGAVGGVAG